MSSIKWFLILFLLPSITFSMELDEGFSRSSESSSLFKLIYQRYKTRPGYLYEYSTGRFYTLSKNGSAIGNYDLNDENDKPKGWPINPWDNQAVLAGESAAAAEVLNGIGVYEKVYGNTYWKVSDPAELKTGSNVVWENRYVYLDSKKHYGCLANTPLRYGDVDGGTPELVLFIEKNIHIFLPSSGKTIFEFNWFNSDELSDEGGGTYQRSRTTGSFVFCLSKIRS